ncbi:MAG: restriction endonuclease subunit S [Rickettsia endosymbiont of Graphium doson]|nr:restriction endonuclease subunit S [Rickettsia endosymbiont of Graphium doson]
MNSPFVHKQFTRVANGITRFGLVKEDINNIKLPLPFLPEQQKITDILRVWDKDIEILTKLCDAKRKSYNVIARNIFDNQAKKKRNGKL